MKTHLATSWLVPIFGSILGIGVLQSPVSAASFNFSYNFSSGDVISGMLEGKIQSDPNIVIVSEVSMPQFNGLPASETPLVFSVSETAGLSSLSPTVTFDGSFMDFIACDLFLCRAVNGVSANGFALFTDDLFGFGSGVLTGVSYGSFGIEDLTPFEPEKWELTVKTPEPTTALLAPVVLGISLFGYHKKRLSNNT